MPSDGAHVWEWFLALHTARGANGFGPNPISWPDVLAWTLLTGINPRPGEVAAIMLLDRLWLEVKAQEKPQGPPAKTK